MTLVLPGVPSFSERLGQGLGSTLGSALRGELDRRQERELEEKEDVRLESLLGKNFRGLRPELKKLATGEFLKRGTEEQKKSKEFEIEEDAYGDIKDLFGEKFANYWKASDPGARTELAKIATDALLRGNDVSELFKKIGPIASAEKQPPEATIPEEISDEIPKKRQPIDYDKGLTPKERVKRQEERYAKALPLVEENREKLRSLDIQNEELDKLDDLSSQIGVFERLNINPQTGELFLPALASPEAQQFVKTVNDFTTQAKASYGARVTNFDLNQFMKRLPTLANSEEGRRRIIKQMKLINQISMEYDKTLNDVLDEHGGIRMIDYDKAQSIAEKEAKNRVSGFKKELKQIGKEQDSFYKRTIEQEKKDVPEGWVLMEHNGEIGQVPKKEIEQAIKSGAKLL